MEKKCHKCGKSYTGSENTDKCKVKVKDKHKHNDKHNDRGNDKDDTWVDDKDKVIDKDNEKDKDRNNDNDNDIDIDIDIDRDQTEIVNNSEDGTDDHKEDIIVLNSYDKDKLDRENNELKGKLSSMRNKLKNSVQREERLNSELRRHNLALTMMKSGINQMIKDKATPPSMIQSLKLLKHSANFSSSDGPSEKKIKLEEHVEIDDVKGEYFEDILVKQETPNEGTAEEKRQA